MLRRFESCTRHVSDSPDPERVRAAASRDSDATVQSTLLGRVLGSPAVPLRVLGRGSLPSVYPVTELAVASVAAAALATRKLLAALGHDRPDAVLVDRRLASLWFGSSLRPQGWQPPPAWDRSEERRVGKEGSASGEGVQAAKNQLDEVVRERGAGSDYRRRDG